MKPTHRACMALALAVGLHLAGGTAAVASDPRDLHGRWAVDPVDCADNRYVWIFSDERAGLFVDNGVVSGWRRASYARIAEGIVSVVFDGAPRREFRWRLTGRDEIATVGIVENGRVVEDRSFQVWRRCRG
jgi:hypothetical protein